MEIGHYIDKLISYYRILLDISLRTSQNRAIFLECFPLSKQLYDVNTLKLVRSAYEDKALMFLSRHENEWLAEKHEEMPQAEEGLRKKLGKLPFDPELTKLFVDIVCEVLSYTDINGKEYFKIRNGDKNYHFEIYSKGGATKHIKFYMARDTHPLRSTEENLEETIIQLFPKIDKVHPRIPIDESDFKLIGACFKEIHDNWASKFFWS